VTLQLGGDSLCEIGEEEEVVVDKAQDGCDFERSK
jgi:hypothetical protein